MKINKIIISPYTSRLKNGMRNAKQYPFWKELVSLLKERNIYTLQVGVNGEERIGSNDYKMNLSLYELKEILFEYDTFISVDNFFHHFAHYYKKTGIVIWSKSDPILFGYSDNMNILKDRKYLRPDQFGVWSMCKYEKEAFYSAKEIFNLINLA